MKTQTMTQSNGTKLATAGSKNKARPKRGDTMTDAVGDEENAATEQAHCSQDDIARRAYDIWLKRGCPEGCDEENWQLAKEELSKTAPTAAHA